MVDNFSTMDEKERQYWKMVGNRISRARNNSNKNRIAYDRRKVKISQDVLASEIGLSRASVANMESGRQRIDLYTFERIMDFLEPQ